MKQWNTEWDSGTRSPSPSLVFREFIASVDAWAARQNDQPGRSEAFRRLVEIGLKAKTKPDLVKNPPLFGGGFVRRGLPSVAGCGSNWQV
jgi:hypothetical protein